MLPASTAVDDKASTVCVWPDILTVTEVGIRCMLTYPPVFLSHVNVLNLWLGPASHGRHGMRIVLKPLGCLCRNEANKNRRFN